MHCSSHRRSSVAASQRAPTALRYKTKRSRYVLHYDWLDDVELARLGTRERSDCSALRRLAKFSDDDQIV